MNLEIGVIFGGVTASEDEKGGKYRNQEGRARGYFWIFALEFIVFAI